MMQPMVNVYPQSNYRHRFKEPKIGRPLAEHYARRRANYMRNGVRRTVGGILLVHKDKHPHVLLLSFENISYHLPGGRVKPGENEIECLKRKLSRCLGATSPSLQLDWQIGECVAIWWKPDFGTSVYPYCPPEITEPKECEKLFVVHLPERVNFDVPRNLDLVPVPLRDLYNHSERFGPILAQIPQQLSRFQVNLIDTCTRRFVGQTLLMVFTKE